MLNSSASFPNVKDPEALESLRQSICTGLKLGSGSLGVSEAYGGTPINRLVRQAPQLTRHTMAQLVKYVSDELDMNKRLKTQEEYGRTVERLLDSPFGKNYTIEDFRVICERMIGKKYFERCKWYEFKEAWEEYDSVKDGESARRRSEQARAAVIDHDNRVRAIREAMQLEHKKPRPTPDEWHRGEDRLTYQEKEQMRERDRQRRNNQQPTPNN